MSSVLSTNDVALLLRCGDEQVELQARQGILPGLKFGREWVFPQDALLAALNRQAIEESTTRRGLPEPTPDTTRPAANAPKMRRKHRHDGPPPSLSAPPSMQACA